MASIVKRNRNDGTTAYLVQIRMKDQKPETATFSRLTDAKKWVQDTESAMRDGRYFKSRESQQHTLAELINTYSADILPARKDGHKTKAQLEWWKGELGYLTLADVTPGRISACKRQLLAGTTYRGTQRSPSTVNRYLAALSVCLTYAVKELTWLDDNPARKVSKGAESKPIARFLSEDETINGVLVEGERTRLLRACRESSNPYLYIVVVLALSTGMRQGEIMKLAWADVNLKQGRITLHDTKNGEIRVVPIAGHALELLKERAKVRHLDTQLLFASMVRRDKHVDLFGRHGPWHNALDAAEITDFRFHDLRHSAASYLAMNGASLAEIAETLGHKTLQMVKRYSHLSEAHNAQVISKLDQRIFGGSE